MSSNVHPVDSRLSNSENNEKISRSPSYDRKDTPGEGADVKYGSNGVNEKDLDVERDHTSEDGDNDEEHQSWFSKIWKKYKPWFHLLFMVVMTG